jgi:hypothetical protein
MRSSWLAKLVAGCLAVVALAATPTALRAQSGATVLKPAETEKLIPATVFYRGQTAATQPRNSGGVRFADSYLVLASLVDTGGYSDAIVSRYQAVFIAEVPIKIAGKDLPAGVYGIGFLAGNKFLVTDIGGHDVLTADSATDAALKLPLPLQVVADAAGGYRLYAGRRYVVLNR